MVKRNPKVSIIVPVYEVEAWLSRCIESILSQTFSDFELILVDDGSPDSCGKIIDEYANRDVRIFVIHQKNMGVSAARNAGIDIAMGKYFSFIDPDDYISKDFLQVLVEQIEYTDADISCCNCDTFSDTEIFERKVNFPTGVMDRNEWISHLFDRPPTIFGSNWNKLFRRSILQYRYDESLQIGEDMLFLLQNSINIRNAVFVNRPLYHVYERTNSVTRADDSKLIQGLDVEKRILKILKNDNKKLFQIAEAAYLDKSLLLFRRLKVRSPEAAEAAYSHMRKYLRSNLKSVLVNKEITRKLKILYLYNIVKT